MSTYTKIHYHVVFATLGRDPCLDRKWREQLWEYFGGTLRGLDAAPREVGGWIDHVHLLFDLKPTHRLSDVMREVKKASVAWIRTNTGERRFRWQEGYGAFTVGWRELDKVRHYIANQEEHHLGKGFKEELIQLLEEAGIPFDPKYLP